MAPVHFHAIVPGSNPAETRAKLQQAIDDCVNCEGDVVLSQGVYEIDAPLRITGDVRLLAPESGGAVLSGGRRLNLTWVPHADGVMRADLPKDIDPGEVGLDQLYLNDERLHLARYPNYDPGARFFGGTAEDALSPERVASWKDPAGGVIHSLHRSEWGGNHWRITGKNAGGELELEGGWMNNRPSGINPKERFVENIFEELDAPGEWYFDRDQRVLYCYPPPHVDLNTAEVVVSGIDRLIEVTGESPETPAGGLHLEGVTLAHTSRTFMETNEPLLRSDWMIHRGGAVFIENAENVVIDNCDFTGLGGNGVFVSGYAKSVAVRGSHFNDLGGSGVCFVGKPEAVRSPSFNYNDAVEFDALDFEPGPQTEDYPRDCVVEDCLLHDLGTVEKQVAGVQVSMAARITMRHLSIYDLPRAGININEGTWGGHLIEGCDVFDTVLMTGDHGSFNAWGRDRFWHPDRDRMDQLVADHPELILLDAQETNVIRNSRWRCDHGWDIDLDDGSSNYEIYNNLCLSGGIKLREGFHRRVYNNIMVNNTLHPHVWFVGCGDVLEKNIVARWYQPIRLQSWGDQVDRNLLPDEAALRRSHDESLDENGGYGDPMFVDPAAADFRVRDGSPALSLGFENFPMDRFGVQRPNLKAIARTPDIPDLVHAAHDGSGDHEVQIFLGASIKKLSGLGERSASGLDRDRGALVLQAPAGSAAHTSGLREGDVMLRIGQRDIYELREVQPAYRDLDGVESALTVFRNQKEIVLDLAETPPEA